MIKSCPDSWNDTSITKQCLAQNTTIISYDSLLKIPVTSTENGITYGNVFCAICNEETKYKFWSVGFTYEYVATSANVDVINSSGIDVSEYSTTEDRNITILDIKNNLSFNETGEMFWSSNVNGSFHKLYLQEKLPSELTSVRFCVPDAVHTCPDNSSCGTNTSYVYYADRTYKNVYCARCNNVTGPLEGCAKYYKEVDNNVIEIAVEEAILPIPHCHEIPADSAAHALLCEKEEDAPPPDSCYGVAKATKKLCYINGYYYLSRKDFYFIDNETIFLHEYDSEFPFAEWAFIDEDKIYVCGTTIPRTKYQRIMNFINSVTTEILIKVSMICILLHLLAFTQLSELQNLSGKNLASFCVALLSAFLLFDVGPWLPSCEMVAIAEHYCFLSCFTWMLIMSYDVWLSLYRATSQFRTSGGKHGTKFLLYSCLAWTLPLLVIGPAIYAEYAPSSVVRCDIKPAYGKYDQCFIGQKKPLFYFFFIPASIIFLVNICFFAHTAYMIYLSQRQTVNPNTRHDFRLYSRLGLLMGLTWTLGSLVTITNSELIGLLFTTFNMSQGIFIFFGFTFKRKTAKGLLHRHRGNKFLNSTFSTFVSTADMGTTVSESTTATRQTQMEVL